MARLPALVLVIAALVIGCRGGDAPAPPGKGGDGTLRLGFVGEPRSLNPNMGSDEHAMLIGPNLFSRLVSIGGDGTLLPELADRWGESADGLSYTFHLRGDVFWHDGRPFTAHDVAVTFTRILNESSNREVATHLHEVTAPDDRTVIFRLNAPWAAFLPALAGFGTSILPAHVYGGSEWRDHPANHRPVGTGPFKFSAWEPGRRIVLEKNDQYFGPGPYVDRLEYLLTATPDAAADLLVAGQADLLVGRPPVHRLRELRQEEELRVLTAPTDARTYLGLNLRRQPFQDLRVRRALNQAIDRRAFVDRALSGIGAPAVGFYTPAIGWAYNGDARVPPYDPAAAKQLLIEALPAGFAATLVCPAIGAIRPLADEVARQLDAVGLPIVVECVPPDDYFRRVLTAHDFDLALMAGSHGPDPDSLAARFGSRGAFQFMGYANAELDAELQRGARHSDTAIRAASYRRAQEILAADLPIVPLAEGVRVTIVRAGVRGLPQDDARDLIPDHTYSLVRLPRTGR